MTGKLIDAIRAVRPDVNVEELADAVWLLRAVSRSAAAGPGAQAAVADPAAPPQPGPAAPPSGTAPVPALPRREEPVGSPVAGATPAPAAHRPVADWYLPRHDRLLEAPARVPVRSPGAVALPGTLAMARALRPLRRRMPSRTAVIVDEEATARQAADADLWVPATLPAPDRWLDLALVVDDSASMVIWRRTCVELRDLVERLGAFRDIRVWRCDTDLRSRDGRLRLHAAGSLPDSAGHDVRELVDPTRRRVVLVVSDCIGRAWQTGEMAQALRVWGSAGPVAIVQTLPQRLWEACAPRFVPARLGARERGAANTELHVQLDGARPAPSGQVPVPVLELAARWFGPWASLVSATGPEWLAGTVIFADGGSPAPPAATGTGPDGASAEKLLAHFASFASTEAQRLAACLAGAPLSLPVMRLVQQAMLPGSRPSVLAEVFLGGLLRQRTSTLERDLDPDEVEYDFAPGVRAVLLATLSRQDKIDVLARVSDYLAARLGSPLDFRAFLTASEDAAALLEHDPPFARVALQVLRDLGGRYREAATVLQRRAHIAGVSEPSLGVAAPEQADPEYPKPDLSSDSVSQHSPIAASEETSPGETVVTSAPSKDLALEHPAEASGQPAIFGGVPYRNPHFTGRDELLEQLHTALHHGTTQMALLPHALHGLGGVGKTQLAIEYAYRYASEYDLVWWVPAESPTTVRSSLAQLADEMKVAAGDVSQSVANVLGALRTGSPYRRWLIVLDNADQPEDFKEFVPVPVGHVLVTSRNPQWADVAAQVEVDVFDREESIALLQRRGHGISAGDAAALAEQLGDLPLALDQAAAWQSETGMPAGDLVRMLDERMDVLLRESPPTTYPVTVMATWELAFSRLREQSPGAAQLLELCAYFGSEPIAVALLWDGGRRADLSGPVARVLQDDIMLRRAIRDMQRHALATVDPSRDQISVHRLVQAVLREQMAPEQQRGARDAVHNILGLANPGDPENPRTWPRHAELLPHVTPSGVVDARTDLARRVALDQTYYRFIRGDYERSRSLGEHAVTQWRQSLGPDHELTLIAQRNLALALRELGDREEAAALNQETLERFREVFGPDHEHTLLTANSVALDLRLRGEFRAARELDEDNLARHRRVFTENHPETLRMMNNVAVNLRLLGESSPAFELDAEALRMHERILGGDNPATLISLTNLARDHFDAGRYRRAEELLVEGLPRTRARVGDDHLVTLMATRVLVMALRRLGEYASARELAEQLYGTARRRYRAGHERVLSATSTYANALLAVGERGPARSLAEQALQRYRETFSDRHPFTLAAAVNLAVVMRAGEEYAAARELDESTLAALREDLGNDHPYTLVAMLNLGTDYAIAHDHQRARELSEEAYASSRRVRGEDHPATLVCGLNYSLDLRATGDRPAAQSLFEQVLAGMRQALGEGHPQFRDAAEGRRADRDIEVWAV